MNIEKQRSRLLITDFTDLERRRLEDIVASLDNIFMYYDSDNGVIGIPPGMLQSVRQLFPHASFKDNSSSYWEFAKIQPVQHNAQPRNQLQIDFINFVLENAKKMKSLAGVLSPGTGKGIPSTTPIPTPTGMVKLADIQVGDTVFNCHGKPVTVNGVFPQGVEDTYEITFSDGRTCVCDENHLWAVDSNIRPNRYILRLKDLLKNYRVMNYRIPLIDGAVEFNHQEVGDAYSAGLLAAKTNTKLDDAYLYNSPDVRADLLRGIFGNNDHLNITNHDLQYQAVWLLWTFGWSAETSGDYIQAIKKDLYITDIRPAGKAECICIKVDDPESLYLTDQFLVTHNTFMACYSAINVGLRTVIIVPTSGIKQQWAETLTGMFNVPPERVNVVNSPKNFINVNQDFTIVSQASLASINKNYDLEKIMQHNKFGIKIIDEVQMWFKNIVQVDSCSNIANNWYLTGTFGRSGETENAIYQEMFGDLAIFREKDKPSTVFNRRPGNVYGMKPHMHVRMIWTNSGLSKGEIESVMDSMRYSEREGKWIRYGISVANYMKLVIPEDGNMTKYLKTVLAVVKLAERQVPYGRTLVLGSTINSAEIVAQRLREQFPDKEIRTYHSRNSKAENEKNKAECDILVSTISSAGTGFDMTKPQLAKLITFAPWASWILSDQISGRLRRRDDGKDCYMYDIVDSSIKQLRVWANNRVEVYKRKCKTFKVIDM